MIDKTHLFLFLVQIGLIIFIVWQGWRDYKFDMKLLDRTRKIYEHARIVERATATIETFGNTTFCACESCKNRECPRKLSRFVIADAVRMGVPIRVDNFVGDCSGYTEEEEI